MTATPIPTARPGHWRIVRGLAALGLGGAAVVLPFAAGRPIPALIGGVILLSGLLELWEAFARPDEAGRRAEFISGGLSVLAGLLLFASPLFAPWGLAVLLGASFVADGVGKVLATLRGSERSLLTNGLVNILIGLMVAFQQPLSGEQALGLYVGLRVLSDGWAMLLGRPTAAGPPAEPDPGAHPDRRLALPASPAVAELVETVETEERARRSIDRYWQLTFLATFFAIHVGRMEAEWSLVGLVSPFVAVVGDVLFALVLALGVVTPVQLAWRAASRPVERRAWARITDRIARGPLRLPDRVLRGWLAGRTRFALRVRRAYGSPDAALRRGLQVGLPLTAVLVATNPIWGFSWYFNTENWATAVWERWVEVSVDRWRRAMTAAVRDLYPGEADAELFRVRPDGVDGEFSFLVVGDPGEGDASQHVLRDQFLTLGQRSDVKFMVIASDVVYPTGAMKDYEPNFYLPFKGFTKPIYAVPGNHDWYDALDAFSANFLEPAAARAALRARVDADAGASSTIDPRIDHLLTEAARLRDAYGVQTGHQRAPFFEMVTERFALIAVDTGVLREVDAAQLAWLRGALDRSRGKVRMVLLGHPLYAAGHYQGEANESFAAVHRLLREHGVEIVMAGDTHDFEHYVERYDHDGGTRPMLHFVNGGGGAYLSIGTALGWPAAPAVPDAAVYPRTDTLAAKLDMQTPPWKQPLWLWTKWLGAWPSSPEVLSGAFDFNRAPFFQSFMEVQVKKDAVHLRLHGTNGPLRWRDLQRYGRVVPDGRREDDEVVFTVPIERMERTRPR